MGAFLAQLGQQLGSAAIGTGMGLLLEKHNDKRQYNQQKKLSELEMENAKRMANFNYSQQMKMWRETGPVGLGKELEKAGLNKGLIYGMSGAGGGTTAAAGGDVTGASAQSGGKEVVDIMGLNTQAAQLALMGAQKENIEADTENKKANTDNTKATTQNTLIDTEIKQVAEHIAKQTQNAQVATIFSSLRKITAEMEQEETKNRITRETADTEIDRAKAELSKLYVQNRLTEAQEQATKTGNEKAKEEIEKIKQEVTNLKNYWDLDNFIEREKTRLMEKGINVALISSTLGSIINFATRR